MKKELTRRDMISRAGLALGGAVVLGALACDEDDTTCPPPTECPPPVEPGPQVAEMPYQQFLPAGYQIDVAAVKETAYHGYYEFGCCHAAFKGLLTELAKVGQPFNLLPINLGAFGAGGIAGYGSICGSLLGSILIQNFVTADAKSRAAMMTDLMRWYEGETFPKYLPKTIDAKETGLTLDFSTAEKLVTIGETPGSHLCHASVSTWCAKNSVSANSTDKKARCARLSADVAGKCAEMFNKYLADGTYVSGVPMDAASKGCVGCHNGDSTSIPSVASGMACNSCHPIDPANTAYPHP